MWLCSDDRTRFPLLDLGSELRAHGRPLQVGLWPVTKAQAEFFLAEPNGFGNAWYEAVLSLNPRASYRRYEDRRREGLLLTGVRPQEAVAFAEWLGDDFDLPTVAEWRALDALLLKRPLPAEMPWRPDVPVDRVARLLLGVLREVLRPRTWGELMLLTGGVFEWVRDGDRFRGLAGRTRPTFLRTVFNPQKDNPVVHYGERSRYFGFRLVRRVPGGGGQGDGQR